MSWHEVVYLHDCPKTGGKSAHVIQYDDEAHEATNLKTHHEHICRWCKQPMKRLGAAVEVRETGRGDDYLAPMFYGRAHEIP